jgi:predicted NBD/HSP70 family sugar kinase
MYVQPAQGAPEPGRTWHDRIVRTYASPATTSAELRAFNLARLLRAVHEADGSRTRAQLTRELALARGTATVLVRELAARELIEEQAGPEQRTPGRPTGVPAAHPRGPVALAVELRDDSYAIAAFELTGPGRMLRKRSRRGQDGTDMIAGVTGGLAECLTEFADRVVGVGVAVPSPVSDGKMVQPTLPEWRDVDVAQALAATPDGTGNVLVGNDATLAGLAEARRGALRNAGVALHLHVATGIGGVLLAAGGPVSGASGAAGEFGHMPLAGGSGHCRCGCVGCWELEAGTRGLLRKAGRSDQDDRMTAAAAVIEAAPADPACAAALADVAVALGRGVGALVNAHDPETIGLSGLAATVYQAAPQQVWSGYQATLMRFHRACPPPLVPSQLGDLVVLTGAAELVFDNFLTPHALAAWQPAEIQVTGE